MSNIIKPLGSAGSADPLDQRATSGWKAITTTKILNDSWIVRIEHANPLTL
jgi:N4-gp56 family major capsid protein